MAKTKISEYSATAANNTDVESVNIAEGCAPSGINNAIREVMSHLKDFQVGSAGDDLTVGGNFSVTGTVTIPDNAISGDKVEGGTINAITINTLTNTGGTANGVTYLNGSKVLTTGSALTWDAQKFEIVPTSDSFFTGGLRVSRYSGGNLQYGTITNNGNLVLTAVEAAVGTPAITFRTSTDGSTSTEQMRLTSTSLYTASGINVGIGLSSPSSKLDVSGVISLQGTTLPTAGTARLFSRSSDSGLYIQSATGGTTYLLDGSQNTMYAATSTSHQWSISNSIKMTLDSSGNLGLGVTPSARLTVGTSTSSYAQQFRVGNATTDGFESIYNEAYSLSAGGAGSQEFYADVEYRLYSGGVGAKTGVIAWHTAISGTRAERMQINQSGNLLVGTTTFSSGQNGVLMRGTSGGYTDEVLQTRTAGTGSTSATGFYNDNGRVGTISTSGTSTAYNTSSDYRLKEDWVAVADASTRVNALKPVNFAWKVDGSRVDGFLAHEVAEVVPEAITGEKDAVELIDIKDEEGNVTGQEERPVYQGIDQSKLVPLLTAALQEALAEINSLKARLDAANL
jgi:hypothetical protein